MTNKDISYNETMLSKDGQCCLENIIYDYIQQARSLDIADKELGKLRYNTNEKIAFDWIERYTGWKKDKIKKHFCLGETY